MKNEIQMNPADQRFLGRIAALRQGLAKLYDALGNDVVPKEVAEEDLFVLDRAIDIVYRSLIPVETPK